MVLGNKQLQANKLSKMSCIYFTMDIKQPGISLGNKEQNCRGSQLGITIRKAVLILLCLVGQK